MEKNIVGIKPHGTLYTRSVHTTIDTLIELFKDFLDEELFPKDAQPLRLMLKPGTKQIGILCTSEEWKDTGRSTMQEIPIKFELKRIHSV